MFQSVRNGVSTKEGRAARGPPFESSLALATYLQNPLAGVTLSQVSPDAVMFVTVVV